MGYSNAYGMREQAGERTALTYHLQVNHYPPVSLDFLPLAEKALACAREGNFDEELDLPQGGTKTVAVVIKGLHLDAFVDFDDEAQHEEE